MIESAVVKILDMEDKTGVVELYKKKGSLFFYESMKILMKSKSFSYSFYVVLKILFFVQTLLELVSLPTEKPDLIHEISVFISDILLFDRLMTDESSFKNMYTLMFIFTFIYMMLVVYLIIYVSKKKMASFPISVLNMFNIFLFEFMIIPVVHMCLEILRCRTVNGVLTHVYLNVACFASALHLSFLFICVIFLVFYFALLYIMSYYMNEIGSMNEPGIPARVNCNYEFFAIIAKLLIHFIFRFVKIYTDNNDISVFNYTKMSCAVLSLIMLVYVHKKVYYFLETYNLISLTGWSFLIWSSLISLLKAYCGLNETTIFHLGGWFGIYMIIYMIEMQKQTDILSNLSPFNLNSIKEVVSFAERILCFVSSDANYKPQSRGTSMALAQAFEEMIESDEHLFLNHNKFVNDDHVMSKFKNKTDLVILSTINLVYDYYQQKNKLYGDRNSDLDEENIFLHACYFLINSLKNHIYSAYLCSTVKVKSNKNNFLHYMMTESVREKLTSKIGKNNTNEAIKRIEVGSVIAHQYYNTLLYSKINEEINLQCDYFSIFQKTIMNKMKGNSKIDQGVDAVQFLALGEEILRVKKDIELAYKQLCLIYPTEDVKRNYINYITVIIQDDDHTKQEEKHFVDMNAEFMKSKGPIYRSLFKANSLFVLVDGYINVGTVLYATSNFGALFTVDLSNVVTLTVHDLVPTAIEEFHYEVVMNGIKYSNLSIIFNKQRCIFVRGVTPNVYLGNVFIRCLPQLSNGLNYLISCLKVEENQSLSSGILEGNFLINGFTNFHTFNTDHKTFKILHIAYYIPNIFMHMKFGPPFGFHFDDASEYIGVFYKPRVPGVFKGTKMTEMDGVLQRLMEKIKVSSVLLNSLDDEDFNYFMQEVEMASEDNFLVHYKLKTRAFVNNKYKYHQVHVNKTGGLNESKNHDDLLSAASFSSRDSAGDGEKEKEGLSNLFDAFSAASQCSQASSFVQVSMKEKLYNINMTKNELVRKEGEIFQFKAMKFLCILFFFVSLILTLISKSITEANFNSMNKFLIDDLYFNQTKMLMTSVYAYVNNLKNIKEGLYTDIKDKDYFVTKTLDTVNDIRELERKIINFSSDIKTILNKNFTISLRTNSKTLVIGVEEYLNLIVSMSLKFTAEIELYMGQTNSIHQLVVDDLNDLIYGYMTDPIIKGFDNAYEESKFDYGNYFSINNYIFSVNIAIIIVIIILFVYFNYSVLTIEQNMLKLIVNFTTPMFMTYLNSLLDYQKRIKVDNNEEEPEAENEAEHSKTEVKSMMKKGVGKTTTVKNDAIEKKNNKKKDEKSKEDEEKEKSFNSYTLISNFFKSKNFFTVMKVVTVLFLSLFFYVISILLITSNVRKVLNFHYSTGEMEKYFFTNFQNYVLIKNQISDYIYKSEHTLDFSQITKPVMGTALFDVKNSFLPDDANVVNLNNIFVGDVCQLIFSATTTQDAGVETELAICQKYLDNMLINGIDQTITQINVFLSAFIPELMFMTTNNKDKATAIKYIFNKNNFFLQFEEFTTKYLYKSYMYFFQTVDSLKTSYITTLFTNFNVLEYFFLVFWAISMFLNFIFINRIRKIFLSFLNFIFIVPSMQILEDVPLMKSVNNLKNYL